MHRPHTVLARLHQAGVCTTVSEKEGPHKLSSRIGQTRHVAFTMKTCSDDEAERLDEDRMYAGVAARKAALAQQLHVNTAEVMHGRIRS